MSAPPPPLPPPADSSGGGAAGGGAPAGMSSGGGASADGVHFRRKDFKPIKTAEDGRQRRVKAAIEIRKVKRTEALKKKRNVGGQSPADAGTAGGPPAAPVMTRVPNEPIVENLPVFADAAHSDDPVAQFEGTKQIRRLLSRETDPPVTPVLEAGVIERFAEFLARGDDEMLQFEAAWALTNIASTEHTAVVVSLGITPLLVQLMVSPNPDVREQCIWCVGNIAGDGHEFRDMVLETEGAFENLVLNITHPTSPSLLRNATWTLSNYCRGKPLPKPEHARRVLMILVNLLANPDVEVLTDTCWALSYLADGDDARIQDVVDSGAVPLLVALLAHESSAVVNPALRAVGNVVTGNDVQTQAVIDAGGLHAFVPLMQHRTKNIKKEATWAVSNVSAGRKEQVSALLMVEGLVETVLHLLDDGPWKVRKEAAWAVSNMTIAGNAEHIHLLASKGCIGPLVKLLDVHDPKIVLVALDALDAIMKASDDYCVEVENHDGIDKMELLYDHVSDEVSAKAENILIRHFPDLFEPTGNTGGGDVEPNVEEQGTFGFGTSGTDPSAAGPMHFPGT